MTFAQRRNCLRTHFSERIPFVKRRISVHSLVYEDQGCGGIYCCESQSTVTSDAGGTVPQSVGKDLQKS